MVKNPPANAGDIKRCRFNLWVRKIPWRRAWQPTLVFYLEKKMAIHSSILAWEIPFTEESCRLLSTGLQKVRHNLATETITK